MAVMLLRHLRRVIRNNVDLSIPQLVPENKARVKIVLVLTNHVSLAVLASRLIRNIGLDAKVDHGAVLDAVMLGIQAADQTEPFAVMNLMAHLVEAGTKGSEGKLLFGDFISVFL